MKDTLKTITLGFLAGCGSGIFTVFLACRMGYVFWSGIAVASFTLAISFTIALAYRFRWIVIRPSRKQLLIAAVLIATVYPVSLIAVWSIALATLHFTPNMRGSLAFELFSYSILFRAPVNEIFEERSVLLHGLSVAAILGALLLAISLRVVTQTWDRRVLIMMVVAVGLLPILNSLIAVGFRRELLSAIGEFALTHTISFGPGRSSFSILEPIYPEPVLFCYNDALLHVFPLGNAFFAALSGYWLKRAFGHDRGEV